MCPVTARHGHVILVPSTVIRRRVGAHGRQRPRSPSSTRHAQGRANPIDAVIFSSPDSKISGQILFAMSGQEYPCGHVLANLTEAAWAAASGNAMPVARYAPAPDPLPAPPAHNGKAIDQASAKTDGSSAYHAAWVTKT